jgi:hypothetical protein
MAKLTGGGSNKFVQSKAPKIEPRSKAMSPETVAQLGASTAFQKKPLEMGPGLQGPVGPTNNLMNGPKGQGRTLYGQCGSQGTYGPVNPGNSAPARDILSSFGPDKRKG